MHLGIVIVEKCLDGPGSQPKKSVSGAGEDEVVEQIKRRQKASETARRRGAELAESIEIRGQIRALGKDQEEDGQHRGQHQQHWVALAQQQQRNEQQTQHRTSPGKRDEQRQTDDKEPIGRPEKQHFCEQGEAHHLAENRRLGQKEPVAFVKPGQEIGRVDIIVFERQERVGDEPAKREQRRSRHHDLREKLRDAGDRDDEIDTTERRDDGGVGHLVAVHDKNIAEIEHRQQQKRHRRDPAGPAQYRRCHHRGDADGEQDQPRQMDAQATDRRQPNNAGNDDEQRHCQLAMKEREGKTRQKNPRDQRQRQQKAGEPVFPSAGHGSALGRWTSQGVGTRVQGKLSD